jgi:hypothetical protein
MNYKFNHSLVGDNIRINLKTEIIGDKKIKNIWIQHRRIKNIVAIWIQKNIEEVLTQKFFLRSCYGIKGNKKFLSKTVWICR